METKKIITILGNRERGAMTTVHTVTSFVYAYKCTPCGSGASK